MSLTEIGQSVMANEFVKKTLGSEFVGEVIAEFEKVWTDMLATKSEEEILGYGSTPVDICNAALMDVMVLDSAKQISKKITDKMAEALSTTDTQDLSDELDKIFQSVGITEEQFDEMVKV